MHPGPAAPGIHSFLGLGAPLDEAPCWSCGHSCEQSLIAPWAHPWVRLCAHRAPHPAPALQREVTPGRGGVWGQRGPHSETEEPPQVGDTACAKALSRSWLSEEAGLCVCSQVGRGRCQAALRAAGGQRPTLRGLQNPPKTPPRGLHMGSTF